MRSIMALALLGLVGAVAARAEGPAGVPKEFIENVNRVIGDWQVEAKVGDTTSKARWSAQWVPGQYAYLLRWEGPGAAGLTRATGLGTWDPRAKAIREVLHDSVGDEFVFLYNSLAPKSAAGEAKGFSQGKPYRARIASEYLGPDEFVWKATDIFIGEDKQPDRVLHFRRVPPVPNSLPEDARKLLQSFVGEWDLQAGVGERRATGRMAFRWAPQRPCLQYDYRVRIGDRDDQNSGLLGWNTADKQLIFAEFGTSGHQSILRLTRQADDAWAGTYDGTLDESYQPARGQCRLERTGPDEFVLSGKGTQGDRPAEWKAVYRRVKSKP